MLLCRDPAKVFMIVFLCVLCCIVFQAGEANTVVSKDVVMGTNHLTINNGAMIHATAISQESHTHFSVYIATTGRKHLIKQVR